MAQDNGESWTVDDDAAAAIASYGPRHPVELAMRWGTIITDDRYPIENAFEQVTPESREAWGADFGSVRQVLAANPNWGVASMVNVPKEARDIAFVKIALDVPETYQVQETHVLENSLIVTFIWRPEADLWLIHAIGDGEFNLDYLPRTSPNSAPELDGAVYIERL